MPKKPKLKPRLLVVFDTNVLYTSVASDLVRAEVRNIIEENSSHPDLEIKWYLPKVVVGERRYQMMGKAQHLLPNLEKLERLLGHSFGVGKDTLAHHVDKAIKNSLGLLDLKILDLESSKVDWENLISRSVNREPPFDPKEKEKGFRDSVIAESFFQLQQASPKSPNSCRLALVTGDQLLGDYVGEATKKSKNVRILTSVDELESLINTLVSTIQEELVTTLTEKAGKLFFEKENDKTLYYKEKIGEKILKDHDDVFANTILPGSIRSVGTWWISNPIFVKKEKQRIHWISPIQPEFEIYHYEAKKPQQSTIQSLADFGALSNTGSSTTDQNALRGLESLILPSTSSPPTQNALLGIGGLHPSSLGSSVKSTGDTQGIFGGLLGSVKVVDLKGREKFEVHWSTNLTQAQNLNRSQLEKIQYIGNDIEDNDS